MDLSELMTEILDGTCVSNYLPNGYNLYHIETHCVAWEIVARKTDGKWDVASVTSKDC